MIFRDSYLPGERSHMACLQVMERFRCIYAKDGWIFLIFSCSFSLPAVESWLVPLSDLTGVGRRLRTRGSTLPSLCLRLSSGSRL